MTLPHCLSASQSGARRKASQVIKDSSVGWSSRR